MKHNQDDFFKGATRQFAGMALVAVIANLAYGDDEANEELG